MSDSPKTLLEAVRHFSDLDTCHAYEERWLAVAGYPKYEVSTFGRVRGVPRRVVAGHGWREAGGKLLRPQPDAAGYPKVALRGEGKITLAYVHRLVLEAFVGPCPPGMEARHRDGNPANNRADNLCWGTHAENIADRRRHGTAPLGERSGTAKLTEAKVREIKQRLAAGASQHPLAREFGISRSLIQAIKAGKVWAHVAV